MFYKLQEKLWGRAISGTSLAEELRTELLVMVTGNQ